MDKTTYSLELRLRIWATDYGRLSGWTMEINGHPIALLTDPQREDGAWTSYRFAPVTQDTKLLAAMKTEQFWQELKDVTWRSRDFNTVVTGAVAAANTHQNLGRITLRGLAISIPAPNFLQQQMVKSMAKKRA